MEALPTAEAKASEVEHAIRHEISARVEENPAFYESLRKRLEEIIEERRQQRIDAAEQLSLLFDLREEARSEQKQAQDMGLGARGHAIYGLLEKHLDTTPDVAERDGSRHGKIVEQSAVYDANRDLASTLDKAIEPFTEVVDWWQKDDLQREMRKVIKQHLRARGLADDDLEALAVGIVDLAKVRAAP